MYGTMRVVTAWKKSAFLIIGEFDDRIGQSQRSGNLVVELVRIRLSSSKRQSVSEKPDSKIAICVAGIRIFGEAAICEKGIKLFGTIIGIRVRTIRRPKVVRYGVQTGMMGCQIDER